MQLRSLTNKQGARLTVGAVLAVVLAIGVVGVVLSINGDLGERHRPLDFPDTFAYDTGSFADYMAFEQRRLRAAWGDAADPLVLANLAPFRLEPGADCPRAVDGKFPNGIALTHDLLGSPYLLQEIAGYFHNRCFLVLGLLLPGHGTRPGDLLQTGWQDWAAAEAMLTRELEREASTVYLAGHGAGATLALLEAAANPTVDGLVLFAPLLGGTSPWYAQVLAPLSRLFPRAGWTVLPDEAVYRHESSPYRLRTEAGALVRAARSALGTGTLSIPVFTVATQEDATADTSASLAFMARQQHPSSRTLLFSGNPDAQPPPGVSIRDSHNAVAKLLSLSHTGLIVPLSDPLFGGNGLYRDCAHYHANDLLAYQRCKAGEADGLGELIPQHLESGVIERVGFNPWLDHMLLDIDAALFPSEPAAEAGPL